MQEPFVLREPDEDSPVLVEVPHAGLLVPPCLASPLIAPIRSIVSEADLYVDELFAGAHQAGATLLVATHSRLIIDLNRGEHDVDATVVDGLPRVVGSPRHGLIWSQTSSGRACLSRPLRDKEFDARLSGIYRPYHDTIARVLARKRQKFGVAILLAAHSMPSASRSRRAEPEPRADLVPGTRGRTTASDAALAVIEKLAADHKLTLRHDHPYAGGWSTRRYGKPATGIMAIQVEICRRLYMDEQSFDRNSGFDFTRQVCTDMVERLVAFGRAFSA
jgi:N-formylglutamate deformylase